MAAAYPAVGISEATIDVYVRELFDVPLAMLKRATSQALESCRFFPTVAELREKADAMCRALIKLLRTAARNVSDRDGNSTATT